MNCLLINSYTPSINYARLARKYKKVMAVKNESYIRGGGAVEGKHKTEHETHKTEHETRDKAGERAGTDEVEDRNRDTPHMPGQI